MFTLWTFEEKEIGARKVHFQTFRQLVACDSPFINVLAIPVFLSVFQECMDFFGKSVSFRASSACQLCCHTRNVQKI